MAEILQEDTNSRAYRSFKQGLPDKLRSIYSKAAKCNNKEYRQHLFKSKLFKSKRHDIIQKAIIKYNKTSFSKGISRQEAQYYDSFIKSATIDSTQLVDSKHLLAQKIQDDNVASIQQVQTTIAGI